MSLFRSKLGPEMGVLRCLERRMYFCDGPGEKFKHQLGDGRLDKKCILYRKDLKGHFGCVNAIEFSNHGGHWITSGGDDQRVLLWNVEKALASKGTAAVMKGRHHSNIFCLAFDSSNSKIFSGGNDEQVIVHDVKSGETLDVFIHQDALYGLSVDPLNDNIFASACDDGRVLIYDIRQPPSEDPFVLAHFENQPMHAVMHNPLDSRLIATANAMQGATLWDIRRPKRAVMMYESKQQGCMSVRFNLRGDRLLALRRRLPPILYDIHSAHHVMEFNQSGYRNSCTMKSCSFAGSNDQYVLSGSDDFRLYMWKIPEELPQSRSRSSADFVLEGHRSIVNQVRYNADNCLIMSSGVEKIIKVWSPFSISDDDGVSVVKTRPKYSHEEYVDLLMRNGPVMTHDYSNESMEEDQRMMAFFDSLVQRESEDVSTDDDAIDSGSEGPITNELSDSESSQVSSDNETLYVRNTSRFPTSVMGILVRHKDATAQDGTGINDARLFGLPDVSSDSSNTTTITSRSPASACFATTTSNSSNKSSDTDESCEDIDRHSSDCSDSSFEFNKTVEASKVDKVSTNASGDILNRLKRLRRSILTDSESEAGVVRKKKRCSQKTISSASRSTDNFTASELDNISVQNSIDPKQGNSSSLNGSLDAIDQQFNDDNDDSTVPVQKEWNQTANDLAASRNLCDSVTSAVHATNNSAEHCAKNSIDSTTSCDNQDLDSNDTGKSQLNSSNRTGASSWKLKSRNRNYRRKRESNCNSTDSDSD